MARVRASLLGVGGIGRHHARLLSASEQFDLVAAYDPAPARSALLPRGCASELEAILAAEFVVIASPSLTHAALVRMALEAGRDVLVEKPLAMEETDARDLAELARAQGRKLFVGHSERFNPVVRELLRRTGAAPGLSRFDALRVGAAPDVDTEDVLLALGVHDLDLLAFLGAKEARLVGAVRVRGGSKLHLVTPSGTATIEARRAPKRERTVALTTAEGGRYLLDLATRRLVSMTEGGAQILGVSAGPEPLAAQLSAAFDALSGRPSDVAVAEDGVRAVTLARLAGRLTDLPARGRTAEKL